MHVERCPSEKLLAAVLEGTLSPARKLAVTEHASRCVSCTVELLPREMDAYCLQNDVFAARRRALRALSVVGGLAVAGCWVAFVKVVVPMFLCCHP